MGLYGLRTAGAQRKSIFHIELVKLVRVSFVISFLKSSVTLERIGRVGRDGFGLFGLREGRLFVPHGQKLAPWQKNSDLHQLFMHFQREAITVRCTLWLNGGAGCFNWSGQGLGRNFGVVNIKGSDVRGALQERKGERGHNRGG